MASEANLSVTGGLNWESRRWCAGHEGYTAAVAGIGPYANPHTGPGGDLELERAWAEGHEQGAGERAEIETRGPM